MRLGFFCGILLILQISVNGEEIDSSSTPSDSSPFLRFLRRNVSISGDLTLNGEWTNSSSEELKNHYFADVQFTPCITIGKALSVSSVLALSTEKVDFNQTISQIGISPSWSWGKVHAGEFSLDYSPFTLKGIPLFGGGFDLHPGGWTLSSCYARYGSLVWSNHNFDISKMTITAMDIGYRTRKNLSVNLIIVKANDPLPDDSALKVDEDSLYDSLSTVDSIEMEINNRAESKNANPKENAVASCIIGVPLFNNAVEINMEAAGCLYTSDTTSQVFSYTKKYQKAGKLLNRFFTPRLSSHTDIALKGDIRFRTDELSGKVAGEFIGPGYVSLGLPYLYTDTREISAEIGYNKEFWSIQANGSYGSDNTLGQKLSTTSIVKVLVSAFIHPKGFPESSIQGMVYNMNKPADTLSQAITFNSILLTGSHRYPFKNCKYINDISLGYNCQLNTYVKGQRPAKTVSGTVGVSSILPWNIECNPSLGASSSSQADSGWESNGIGTLLFSRKFIDDRLENSLKYTVNAGKGEWSQNGSLSASFSIIKSLSASLMFNHFVFKSKKEPDKDLRETSGKLTAQYSF